MQPCHQIHVAASLVNFRLPPRGLIQLSQFDDEELHRVLQEVWQAGQLRLSTWKQQLWLSQLRPQLTPAFWRAAQEFVLADVLVRVWLAWLRTLPSPTESLPHDLPSSGSYDNYWSDLEAVVDCIRQGHDEFRARLLNRVAPLAVWSDTGLHEFHRSFRQAAFWNDCLLAVLAADCRAEQPEMVELFHDPHRRTDWRLVDDDAPDGSDIILAGVRQATAGIWGPAEGGHDPLHRRWVAAVVRSLGLWDPDVRAHFPDAWNLRVEEGADELHSWISAYEQSA